MKIFFKNGILSLRAWSAI